MYTQEKSSPGEPGSPFKEAWEKKQNLKRIASEVGVMAAELQNGRSRAVAREAALQEEVAKRQAAQSEAQDLAERLEQMHKLIEDRDAQAQANTALAEQYAKELAEVRERLAISEEVAEACSATAGSAQVYSEALQKTLEEKSVEIQEQRNLIVMLEEQLIELQKDLMREESSQKQLRYEVQDLEAQIQQTIGRTYASKEFEFRKLLNEVSARNIDHLEKHMQTKDDEVARLRQEVKGTSTELRLKTLELDAQLEKHRREDQELNKRVIKLELCLQEARSQTKKLKKMGEKKDQEIQNLRAQLWLQEAAAASACKGQHQFWNHFRLPTVLSMSAVALLCLLKH